MPAEMHGGGPPLRRFILPHDNVGAASFCLERAFVFSPHSLGRQFIAAKINNGDIAVGTRTA
jgi:hypothetical protein